MVYKFTLKSLPYETSALEPFIDTATMELHHGKHVQAYVNNLNNALEKHVEFHRWTLVELNKNLEKLPSSIRTVVQNNAGGIYNHDLFFATMAPGGRALDKSSPLGVQILKTWGSRKEFEAEMKAAAMSVFGSGWAWLVADSNGELSIVKTANQDTPLAMDLTPVLNVDVWEHSYYLKHQNRRADYLDAWCNVINWEEAARNYTRFNVRG